MRIPEHPPDLSDILSRKASEWAGAFQKPEYQDLVQSATRNYRHWNTLKYIARSRGLDPELVWFNVKMHRQMQAKKTPFQGADGKPVRYSVPDELVEELSLLDRETGQVIADSEIQMPSGSQRERFIIRALTEEAIASSLLEGAATTRQEAKDMIRNNREPRTPAERMVTNNYNTMIFIREHSDTPMSPEFLLDLQRMLTKDTLKHPDQSGRFRTSTDTVHVDDPHGETVYTPPAAEELPHRLKTICNFANSPESDPQFIHPIIRACLLHFQIAIDHPYCDGNGRTARAIFYWYVLRHKYWLFEFMPISTLIRKGPSKYAVSYLYAETDDYDATYFLMYNAGIFRRARQEMNEYIQRKLTEQRKAARLLHADTDLNLRQRQVLLRFARDPDRQITIDGHGSEFQISYQTARSDLLDLVKREYLASFKGGQTYIFIRGRRLAEIETAN